MEPVSSVVTSIFVEAGWSAAAKAWDHRSIVRQKLTRLWNRLRHGRLKLAILGAGGVGKSTFGQLLTGEIEADTLPGAYRESLVLEKYELPGDLTCTMLVPPGQAHRREESSWTGLERALATDDCAGIVHVVAWGYHAFGELGYTRHKAYEPGMTVEQFMDRYSAARRAEELRVVESLMPALRMRKHPLWFITLVTKQDLWWRRRQEVNHHYLFGDYQASVEKIKGVLGEPRFKHQVVSASLVWNNLRDHDGNVLAETTGGYEQATRAANLERVIDAVHDLLHEGVSS